VNGSGGNATLKDLFVIPNNERWYTTRFSQMQIINIDSTKDANADVASTEVPWVKQEAAAMHDGINDPTFVVAAWHHPACSSQYYTRQGERAWVQDNLVASFKTNGGVDLILAAHDKYYERNTITGGIVHVITNIGNVSPEIPGGNHPSCTVQKSSRSSQSVLFMNISGDTLVGRVLDQALTELDTFTITK
jgi:3',5'-cyclic AMP phosphodiesterase CpdA